MQTETLKDGSMLLEGGILRVIDYLGFTSEQ